MNSKAFISHASEDKDRFVVKFSEFLRSNGVDAWLDRWEMQPGDSLVDRIFEEGIKEADVFIIVLSKFSVSKPWVREELNAGLVKKIERACKIIPVVIDECEIPECLKSTVWRRIKDLFFFEDDARSIVNAILGISEKPPLGALPKHVSTVIDVFTHLTKADAIVLDAACSASMTGIDSLVRVSTFNSALKDQGMSDEEIEESLGILKEQGYIHETSGGHGYMIYFRVSAHAFDQYLHAKLDGFDDIVHTTCLAIVNDICRTNEDLFKHTGQTARVVNHVLDRLEGRGLIKQIKFFRGARRITDVSVQLKRNLREL